MCVPGHCNGEGIISDGVGDGFKAVDNGVSWCDSQDSEKLVTEVNCVGDAEGLSFGVDDAMAVVVLEGDANVEIETVKAVEVPGVAGGCFFVDDDGAAK